MVEVFDGILNGTPMQVIVGYYPPDECMEAMMETQSWCKNNACRGRLSLLNEINV